MQNLVGIFRTEEDLTTALAELEKLKQRATRVRVEGSRLFNPGWHLSRDLKSHADSFRSRGTQRAGAQGEPRRAQPHRLSQSRMSNGVNRTM